MLSPPSSIKSSFNEIMYNTENRVPQHSTNKIEKKLCDLLCSASMSQLASILVVSSPATVVQLALQVVTKAPKASFTIYATAYKQIHF